MERGSTSSSLGRENSMEIFPVDEKKKQKKHMIKYSIVVLCGALLCSILTGIAVYFSRKQEIKVRTVANLEEMLRIDCLPDEKQSKSSCERRGCIWSTSVVNRVPSCFFPKPDKWGYNVLSHPEINGPPFKYVLGKKSKIFEQLLVEVDFLTEDLFRIKVKEILYK